jgi:hypothetical protein
MQPSAQLPPPAEPPKVLSKTLLERIALIISIITPVAIGVGSWMITRTVTNEQISSQTLQFQASKQDQDHGRVMERLVALGSSSVSDRVAAAKALHAYAYLNKMDSASLPGLLYYLRSECDEGVFSIAKDAAVQAIRNSPPTPSTDEVNVQRTITGIMDMQRSSACPGASATPPATSAQVVSAPPRYFDVDCERVNSGVIEVAAPGIDPNRQAVKSVEATLANIDNLKTWSVKVLNATDRSASVQYQLVGLDRQFLGNCPGGGHGSVVTNFVIGPK